MIAAREVGRTRGSRIAVVLEGDPEKGGAWSGVPAGLISGLRQQGCEVTPVNAEIRGMGRLVETLGMSWAQQSANPVLAAACSVAARRRLRAAGPLDGAVAIGSGYSIETPLPYATFEDMTVAQALRQPEPVYEELGEAAAERWRNRQKQIFERAAACCVASHWAAKSVEQDYGIDPQKVHVVGVGSNVEIADVERDWSIPRFLYVGIDWERKRGADVVAAFAEVRKSYPDATLDLVGVHPQIEAEGVIGHGKLPLGSERGQREYRALLQRATCMLMPSLFEPYGIAYLDAAVAGVPSIGTTVGGAPDAVGEGGRVVDPADPRALTAAMSDLADPETARRYGERAARRAPELTWKVVAGRVLDALLPKRRSR
jgi:glycosyltransferase involved in cell wall biosynthesis